MRIVNKVDSFGVGLDVVKAQLALKKSAALMQCTLRVRASIYFYVHLQERARQMFARRSSDLLTMVIKLQNQLVQNN